MFTTREDIIWAAGLFEGEGCFSIMTSKAAPTAKLAMVDDDVVRRFADIVGFGRLTHRDSQNPRHADQFEWEVSNLEEFQATVAMLWPGLGRRRRARASEILRTIRDRGCNACGGPLVITQSVNHGRGRVTRWCPACRSRGGQKTRRSHCRKGHPYDQLTSDGRNRCGTCKREHHRRWRQSHPGYHTQAARRQRAARRADS